LERLCAGRVRTYRRDVENRELEIH
jgi:hypothetical protein